MLEDDASEKVLREIWKTQREKTDAAVPLGAAFKMDESQARKSRSLSPQRLFQGSRSLEGDTVPVTFAGVV